MAVTRKTVVLVALLAAMSFYLGAAVALASDAPDHVVKLLYFHRRFRCPACETIEKGIEEVLKTSFSQQLASGAVTWQVIDLDEKGNEHYPETYDFFYNTLIVADERGGKNQRYKNLQKVYEYEEDIPGLHEFVRKEVEEYLK